MTTGKSLLTTVLADETKEAEHAAKCAEAEARLRKLIVPTYLPALHGAFMLAGTVEDWRVAHYVSTYWRTRWNDDGECIAGPHTTIQIYFNFEVDRWSDLTRVFEVLDAADLHLPLDGWTSRDDAVSYTRVYQSELALRDDLTFTINLCARLPGDTDTCRRVIVGYREADAPREPEPIYELQCDGEPITPSEEF